VGLTCCCLILLPAFLRHHLPDSTKSYFFSLVSTACSKLKGLKAPRHGSGWKVYGTYDIDSLNQGSCPDLPRPTYSAKRTIEKTNMFTAELLHSPRSSTNNTDTGEGMQESNSSLALRQNGTNQFTTDSVYQPCPIYMASSLPYTHPQYN
jgi:hypothetical protein